MFSTTNDHSCLSLNLIQMVRPPRPLHIGTVYKAVGHDANLCAGGIEVDYRGNEVRVQPWLRSYTCTGTDRIIIASPSHHCRTDPSPHLLAHTQTDLTGDGREFLARSHGPAPPGDALVAAAGLGAPEPRAGVHDWPRRGRVPQVPQPRGGWRGGLGASCCRADQQLGREYMLCDQGLRADAEQARTRVAHLGSSQTHRRPPWRRCAPRGASGSSSSWWTRARGERSSGPSAPTTSWPSGAGL